MAEVQPTAPEMRTDHPMEQDDIFISFLNEDCLDPVDDSYQPPLEDENLYPKDSQAPDCFSPSFPDHHHHTDSKPLSPPWSTSSLSDGGLNASPRSIVQDDIPLCKDEPLDWQLFGSAINASTLLPASPQQDDTIFNSAMQISGLHPDFSVLSTLADIGSTGLPYITPLATPVDEQPKKKRGRKKAKQDNAPVATTQNPNHPTRPRLVTPSDNASEPASLPSPPPAAAASKLLPASQPISPKQEGNTPIAPDRRASLASVAVRPATQILPAVKAEPSTPAAISSSTSSSSPSLISTSPGTSSNDSQDPALAAAIAKRQERLIKNRAAALLSRKRKREHVTNLEQHNEKLSSENLELKSRIEELEQRVDVLVKERDAARKEATELRERFMRQDNSWQLMDIERDAYHHGNQLVQNQMQERVLSSKTTGVVFMIILFSFALFTLPTTRLTIGGVGSRPLLSPSPPSFAGRMFLQGASLLDGSTHPAPESEPANPPAAPEQSSNTDIITFTESKDVQIWLADRLEHADSQAESKGSESEAQKGVSVINKAPGRSASMGPSSPLVYCPRLPSVFSPEMMRAVSNGDGNADSTQRLRLSLLSPLAKSPISAAWTDMGMQQWALLASNHNSNSSEGTDSGAVEPHLLQVDVEVVGSRLVPAPRWGLVTGDGKTLSASSLNSSVLERAKDLHTNRSDPPAVKKRKIVREAM
ncbi:uncharacterized protein VTP21DRAFT_10999 [Calcarisporiella thermophila]|uniref:uncharacterized protein n=1 Tax=Calcarisporiella thermophila TaxID=911321 RepID=UPI003743242E